MLSCALLGLDEAALSDDCGTLGQLLENLRGAGSQDPRRQASWGEDDKRFHHMRDKEGVASVWFHEYLFTVPSRPLGTDAMTHPITDRQDAR